MNKTPNTPTPITTPDGRTVEDVIEGHYEEMILDLDHASGTIQEMIDSTAQRLRRLTHAGAAEGHERSNIANELQQLAEALADVEKVRDDLLNRTIHASMIEDMFAMMAARAEGPAL